MNVNLIWQTALIIVVGTLLLRIAGRKTISQMTLAETILMISIGTLLISGKICLQKSKMKAIPIPRPNTYNEQ
ncbi:hypothetical protein [Sporosarcina sp. HYO08]|uniref:hypothetical protein n=1 Tax=Sporosarcina sp. HYO08 TaxID=1759557 RepID=UPI00079BF3EF|nr:hypothetical protein [Sporosarcina sp. HYO08]KXH81887.1 hypothetical protein AU377_06385 [Sporosarcina sp. HYO08]